MFVHLANDIKQLESNNYCAFAESKNLTSISNCSAALGGLFNLG